MKYVKIDNYKCNECNGKEYDVIFDNSGDVVLIVCAECGAIYEDAYEVIEE